MADEYTCEECGQTFEKGWTDADANAEAVEAFGAPHASDDPDMAIVCDDCYRKLVADG
jgi:DNA-directed RNA polymerase subunit RPC12/RpoP